MVRYAVWPTTEGKGLKKRTWVYVHHPTHYDIRCDSCWNGDLNETGTNIDWSEYEHMIWCYDCKKDLPGFSGIFDGPIPMGTMELLGVSLNRIYLKSKKMFKPVTTKDRKQIVYRQCGKKDLEKFTLVRYPDGKKGLEICICDMPWGPCRIHGIKNKLRGKP